MLTRQLNASLAELPEVAQEAARRTLRECVSGLLACIGQVLDHGRQRSPLTVAEVQSVLHETRMLLGNMTATGSLTARGSPAS